MWNDIKFNYAGGQVSLINKVYLSQLIRNSFPDSALYISKNNWYLDCAGSSFVVHAPDGTEFTLSAKERIASTRDFGYQGTDTRRIENYSQYYLYVDTIKKPGATATYKYANRGGDDPYNAAEPVFIGEDDDNQNRSRIRNKQRLESISVVAENDGASEAVRTISAAIEYYGDDSNCPHLIKRISSPNAVNTAVEYSYRKLAEVDDIASEQCVLDKVTQSDGSFWQFDYGQVDTQQKYIVGADPVDGLYKQSYLPIKSIILPTGAKVEYSYYSLPICEYQDVYEDNSNVSIVGDEYEDCPAPYYRRPAVTKRTLLGRDIKTSVHNIGYNRPSPNTENVVKRFIDNEKRRHILIFGRIDRFQSPLVATPESGRRLHSGRLLSHKVNSTGTNSKTLSVTKHRYYEPISFDGKDISFFDYDSFSYPPASADNFRLLSGRYKFLYDGLRINRTVSTINFQGMIYQRRWRSHNEFNQPTRFDEDRKRGDYQLESRTTEYEYDNNYASRSGGRWIIGLPTKKRVGESLFNSGGVATNVKSGTDLVYEKGYTDLGWLKWESDQGFVTHYTYYNSGDVHTVQDGRGNVTRFEGYQNGVAFREYPASGGSALSFSDPDGLVYKTQDAERRVEENFRYDSLGRVTQQWLSSADRMITEYPQWHSQSSSASFRQRDTLENHYQTDTWFDSLGRVRKTRMQDLSGNGKNVWTEVRYDAVGNVIFESDSLETDPSGGNAGIHYTHDALGRVLTRKHNSEPVGIKYCYGAEGCENTASKQYITDGFVVTDQYGYETSYDLRALGHPSNKVVSRIVQDIEPGGASRVSTRLWHNIHNFTTKVRQGGIDRTYTPYYNGSVLTMLPGSETHPEFGTRTVTEYDGAGNIHVVQNFNGDIIRYTYNALNQIESIRSGTLEKQYDYDRNGAIVGLSDGPTSWEYSYHPNTGLLKSETLSIDGESFPLSYGYSDALYLENMVFPDGITAKYQRNGYGQATGLTAQIGSQQLPIVTGAQYHVSGQVEQQMMGNGQLFRSTLNETQLPEVWQVKDPRVTDTSTVGLIYLYDRRFNVSRIKGYFRPYGGAVKNMEYDGLNRLVRADGRWGEANYIYDKIGNIVQARVGGVEQNYTYTPGRNRLESVSSSDSAVTPDYASILYDGSNLATNGNIINNGRSAMTYDRLNRLVTAQRVSGSEGNVQLTNTYDGNNYRTKATVTKEGKTTETYYVYASNGNLMYEYDRRADETLAGESRSHLFFNGQSLATLGTHRNIDSDGDSLPDYYERLHGLDASYEGDAYEDPDGDGINNRQEYLAGSSAMSTDSDGDGMDDAFEWEHHLQLGVYDSGEDPDGDGISTSTEIQLGTNPTGHLFTRSQQMNFIPQFTAINH